MKNFCIKKFLCKPCLRLKLGTDKTTVKLAPKNLPQHSSHLLQYDHQKQTLVEQNFHPLYMKKKLLKTSFFP